MPRHRHAAARSRRPPLVPLLTILMAGLLGALLPAGAARAEGRALSGGRLDWGIKSSFQAYITGPVAHGGWALTGGAATVGNSRFRFPSATGSYDPDSGALTAAFAGGVRFTGHRRPDGTHELDLTVGRPKVVVSGGRGTLYADVTSKAKGTGEVTSAEAVPLASLDLAAVDTRGGGTPIGLTDVPTRLTSQGAKAFAGYYPAGTALDPLSLSADVRTTARPTAPPTEPRDPVPPGTIADAAVDWGVRRTFREYVTGSLNRGAWTVADGARDGGALFRFSRGSGTYDAENGTVKAEFAGTVRFTGEHLDLALGKVGVTVEDGEGTLFADVTTGGSVARHLPLVTFRAGKPAPKGGLLTVTEAPAKITAAGARALGGLYRAGTDMDPVSLSVALDRRAALPALPDAGSGPAPTGAPKSPGPPQKTGAPHKPDPDQVATAASSSSVPPAVLSVAVAGGLLLVAAAAFLTLRSRRRREARAGAGPDAP
ncbi:HtaA domain-containing protein [Streptomyces sp. NPDC003077]|uniref:HtaA domain-containing protein n=1 Tax=Streptomyces sp. NPDC003077 TaxID=3154443 RepID=UPI0033A810A1